MYLMNVWDDFLTKQFKMMQIETVVRTQALANEQPRVQYAGFGTNLV